MRPTCCKWASSAAPEEATTSTHGGGLAAALCSTQAGGGAAGGGGGADLEMVWLVLPIVRRGAPMGAREGAFGSRPLPFAAPAWIMAANTLKQQREL